MFRKLTRIAIDVSLLYKGALAERAKAITTLQAAAALGFYLGARPLLGLAFPLDVTWGSGAVKIAAVVVILVTFCLLVPYGFLSPLNPLWPYFVKELRRLLIILKVIVIMETLNGICYVIHWIAN
ncbi:MAG: hypothetical protein ABIJ61_14305 [bacterium]